MNKKGRANKTVKVLALMGSPRLGGNTDALLEAFLAGVQEGGGEYEKVAVAGLGISGCRECLACSRTGRCVIEDDMAEIYPRLLSAGKIAIASPIFFYGLPSQLKALIDRCQAVWESRRLSPPPPAGREAFTILAAATRGRKLFDGALLTLRYFLEALSIAPVGNLTFRGLDRKGDVDSHPEMLEKCRQAGFRFVSG